MYLLPGETLTSLYGPEPSAPLRRLFRLASPFEQIMCTEPSPWSGNGFDDGNVTVTVRFLLLAAVVEFCGT